MKEGSGQNFLRPWLWLSPLRAHDLSQYLLPPLAALTPSVEKKVLPLDWKGIHFENPLGIAGGVDKNGHCLSAWKKLGAGFLEVGTVTPEPQKANPGVILMRDTPHKSLWNKMGFPNGGAKALAAQLKKLKKESTPLFINVGKNRWTENDQAHLDYISCIKTLSPFADAFVINVSSPNTKGLRDLLAEKELEKFLIQIREGASLALKSKPLLLKLSPDMGEEALRAALAVSSPWVQGWILTNTTRERWPGCPFPENEGGVSGEPLRSLSQKALTIAALYKIKDPEKLIVSVGGISSGSEVMARLHAGADLVQFYSALVFTGPSFFRKTIKELKALNH